MEKLEHTCMHFIIIQFSFQRQKKNNKNKMPVKSFQISFNVMHRESVYTGKKSLKQIQIRKF